MAGYFVDRPLLSRVLHMNVQSSTVSNGSKLDATQYLSPGEWESNNVVHTYRGILLSNRKLDEHVDEPQKSKMLDTEN